MPSLSPLDGRYKEKVEELLQFLSEEALMRYRLYIEIEYLIALSKDKKVKELPPFTQKQIKDLYAILDDFSEDDVDEIRSIEKETNHDVKAIEYFLRKKLTKKWGKKAPLSFIHFALTSEDVNNLSYSLMVQDTIEEVMFGALLDLTEEIEMFAENTIDLPLLSLTHGQPATPTTLGKEMYVFVERLNDQIINLFAFRMHGKFGGAVGNYSAHFAAYPTLDWHAFGKKFIESLELHPRQYSTQINPHDDLAELSHLMVRINTIFISFARDIWTYISRSVLTQKVVATETGSSTMPHKVNPIDFENAEGNLGLSNALFTHFAEKLPISRLQRDLTDSTVQRSIGSAFGYQLIAIKSLLKGMSKISPNETVMAEELAQHPEVHAEAIQTVMRREGIADAYEQLKKFSRGKALTKEELCTFIDSLLLETKEKNRLKKMMG